MKNGWKKGNRVVLLENGEAYYPRVFDAIAGARFQILIETFILYEDKIGLALKDVLLDAVARGVAVTVRVDGWGSPPSKLSEHYIRELADAGVNFQVYGELSWISKRLHLARRLELFRRMHRKMVVIDGRLGYIGGINFSADHLADYGPESKQDYAVELTGPIVDDLHRFLEWEGTAPAGLRARWRRWRTAREVRAPNPPS
ncbi:MAG TPA: phospholipase D-like domain-containing protein, partial [Noviherbaspirillum sp.]|nr:phospholipase D-like domain-containing protein [Noviherbaspirillum sp.]